jgi:hypothetical protein
MRCGRELFRSGPTIDSTQSNAYRGYPRRAGPGADSGQPARPSCTISASFPRWRSGDDGGFAYQPLHIEKGGDSWILFSVRIDLVGQIGNPMSLVERTAFCSSRGGPIAAAAAFPGGGTGWKGGPQARMPAHVWPTVQPGSQSALMAFWPTRFGGWR